VFVFLLAYLAYESEKPEFCLNCHCDVDLRGLR
jgi:hypothetical protein